MLADIAAPRVPSRAVVDWASSTHPARQETEMATFSTGDRVSWGTSQGRTQGEVVERKTADFQHDGQQFRASDDEPAFIVESEKTGARAAHKGSALRHLTD